MVGCWDVSAGGDVRLLLSRFVLFFGFIGSGGGAWGRDEKVDYFVYWSRAVGQSNILAFFFCRSPVLLHSSVVVVIGRTGQQVVVCLGVTRAGYYPFAVNYHDRVRIELEWE